MPATAKYIEVNGLGVNFKLGSVSGRLGTKEPSKIQFQQELLYSATIPTVGQEVGLFLRNDTKLFGGTVDRVKLEGLYESASMVRVTVECVGFNNRLFIRSTRDRLTSLCARYRSLSSTVSTAGTVVAWISGDYFSQDLVGKTVQVNSINRVVASVTTPEALVLTTSAGTNASVAFAYTIYSGTVIKDLLDVYCSFEGFSYTGTSIQQGAAITELAFNPPIRVIDAIRVVLSLNPTFYFDVDPNQVVYFAVSTLVSAPSSIVQGSPPWKRKIDVETTREDVRNAEISIFNEATVEPVAHPITGDSTRRSWFLPSGVGTMVKVELNAVEVAVGAEGTADKFLYYRQNDSAVWQDPAFPVLEPTDTLVVFYKPYCSNLDEYSDEVARAARATAEGSGLGKYEEVIDRTSFPGVVEAHAAAIGSVALLKDNLVLSNLEVVEDGFMPGQIFTLNIAKRNINLSVFIDTVELADEYAEAIEAESIDFLYRLHVIAASRRLGSSEILGSLFGGQTGSSGSVITGGGSVTGAVQRNRWVELVDSGSHVLAIDLANGLNHHWVLGATAVTIDEPIWTGQTVLAGDELYLYVDQDGTGGRAGPLFDSIFTSDAALASDSLTPDANAGCVMKFRYDGAKWRLDYVFPGRSIS